MKIAEALTKMKDLKGKISSLQTDIMANSTFERLDENDPVPNVEGKFDDLKNVIEQLRVLKTAVEAANNKHGLADKIHEMEQLRYLIKALEPLSRIKQEHKSIKRDYVEDTNMRVSTFATFNVANLNIGLEDNRARIRELDLELQRRNWEIDL